MRILCALSGGVDSGCCALLLQRLGYEVCGVTFGMLPTAAEKLFPAARRLCAELGIPHYSTDLSDRFSERVTSPFIDEYLCGRTPNPCVICNREIKFPALFETADSLSIDLCATGHYARIEEAEGRYYLKKAADHTKDQTYVLWNLTRDMLSRLRFPLGEYTKSQIRAIASENGLTCAASKDSQDICFIPDGNYASYIESHAMKLPKGGNYVDAGGCVLGSHGGHHRVTLGQSKGLGIALGERVYVTAKDAQSNTVTLGTNEELYKSRVTASSVNVLIPEALSIKKRLSAKVRYGRQEETGCAELCGDKLFFTFDSPVRAPCPGQSLVIYDGDLVVAGGIITDAL